jgi:hypothetical protein
MKKLFLAAMLVMLAFTGQSQVIVDEVNINDLDVKYIELVGRNKIGFGKIKIVVDFGQELKIFKSQAIRSADGTKAAFNSMIDGLNFMEANGWEFVSNYVVQSAEENEIRYILRRRD